jgi:hypothetical protein
MDSGWREENASQQKTEPGSDFIRTGIALGTGEGRHCRVAIDAKRPLIG